jgi:hypothetical protein
MQLGPLATKLTKSIDTAVTELVDRLMSGQVKSPYAKLLIARLTTGAIELAAKVAPTVAERLLKAAGEVFTLSSNVAVAGRRGTFAHLFGAGLARARADAARRSYFRLLEDLGELVKSAEGTAAVETGTLRTTAEKVRNQIADNVGFGVFDRYGDLSRETGTLNTLNRVLTPDQFPGSIRLDAHHLIEDRMYKFFPDDWKLLGWESSDDMMATAIQWESHIRSSASKKGLPGFEDRPDALLSLTKRLLDEIPDGKYKNADDLIDAYIHFYKKPVKDEDGNRLIGGEMTNRIVDALQTIKKELRAAKAKAQGGAAVVAKAKQLPK